MDAIYGFLLSDEEKPLDDEKKPIDMKQMIEDAFKSHDGKGMVAWNKTFTGGYNQGCMYVLVSWPAKVRLTVYHNGMVW